jgi:hypothetical protein
MTYPLFYLQRLLVTAMLIADKFLEDDHCPNSTWSVSIHIGCKFLFALQLRLRITPFFHRSRIAGISLTELNRLEVLPSNNSLSFHCLIALSRVAFDSLVLSLLRSEFTRRVRSL